MSIQDLKKVTIRTGTSREHPDSLGSKQYGYYDVENRILYLIDDFNEQFPVNATGTPSTLVRTSGYIKKGHQAVLFGEYSVDDDSTFINEGELVQLSNPNTVVIGIPEYVQQYNYELEDGTHLTTNTLIVTNSGSVDIYGESSSLIVSSREVDYPVQLPVIYSDVSNPPTKSELTAIYLSPELLPDGTNFIVQGTSNVWSVSVSKGEFAYQQLTVAV